MTRADEIIFKMLKENMKICCDAYATMLHDMKSMNFTPEFAREQAEQISNAGCRHMSLASDALKAWSLTKIENLMPKERHTHDEKETDLDARYRDYLILLANDINHESGYGVVEAAVKHLKLSSHRGKFATMAPSISVYVGNPRTRKIYPVSVVISRKTGLPFWGYPILWSQIETGYDQTVIEQFNDYMKYRDQPEWTTDEVTCE